MSTERLRIRTAAGASLADIAALLGVSPAQALRYERGAVPRDPELLTRYVQVMEQLEAEFADASDVSVGAA